MGAMPRSFGLQRHASAGHDGDDVPVTRARLSRVAAYFKPYWAKWLVIVACISVTSALGVLPPQFVRGILDNAIPDKDPGLLHLLVGAIVVTTVVAGLVNVLQSWLNQQVGQGIMFDLRNDLYHHLQDQSLGFYTTTRAGEIVSRLNNDVGAVQQVATRTVVSIVSNVMTLVATAIAIFCMDWRLAVLAVVIVPTFYLPTRLVGRIRRRLSQLTQEHQADLVAFMEERLNIGGVMLAKIFGQAEADAETFEQHSREVMDLNVKQAMAGRWLFMCLAVFSVAGPALIYWFGGQAAIEGRITVGTIIAFVAYLTNLYRPVGQLANVYVNVQGALACFERIFEYLDLRPDVEDQEGAVELDQVEGRISIEDVSFAYPRVVVNGDEDEHDGEDDAADRLALDGVSFDIEPGERVAIVGPSGAGKTTVTYLLPRFYDPRDGRITLDGRDLREVTQDSLRRRIGAVTQDTFLFHDTVRANLLYARPEATEEEITAAAQAAHIHDFIAGLPEGYETMVGERGFRLSGGEKQRLAIARALLKDPKILILDEATSNLDATSEYLIQQALETLLKGRTAVIIAHRLSTILTADKIIVLNEGKVEEVGHHDDLIGKGGLYATLYHQQFSKVVEQTIANGPPDSPAQ